MIWVSSELGAGSTFSFTLPIANIASAPARPAAPEVADEPYRARVAIMERNQQILNALQNHLPEFDIAPLDSADADHLYASDELVIMNRDCAPPPDKLACPSIEYALPRTPALADELVMATLIKPVTPTKLLRELAKIKHLRRVLVIDDNRGFVQMIERILRGAKPELSIARAFTSREGLRQLTQALPDVILLDLYIAQDNGLQLLRQIREQPAWRDIPIILITAHNLWAQHSEPQEQPGTISLTYPGPVSIPAMLSMIQHIATRLVGGRGEFISRQST